MLPGRKSGFLAGFRPDKVSGPEIVYFIVVFLMFFNRTSFILEVLLAVKPLRKMIILVLVFCCFGSLFGQSWSQDPFERITLEKWSRNHLYLDP